jgi:hypothetical protein
VQFNITNLVSVSVYYHDYELLTEERLRLVRSWRRAQNRFVVDLIAQAQADGDVARDADPRVLANLVFGTVIWTYRWYQPGGRWSRETIADHCAAYALHGVVGPGALAGS